MSPSEEALLLLLKSLGHKRSTNQRTLYTTYNSTLEWLFPQGIEATSEQDLLVALSTLFEAQNTLALSVHGVQAAIHHRQNNLLPICNLPIEIFTRIVKIASEAHAEKPAEYLGELSLVCRNWNAIIQNTPILWSNIVCGDQVGRALKNSKEVPLVAQIPIGEARSRFTFRRFIKALGPHAHKLQSFSAVDFGYNNEIGRIYPLLKAIHKLHIAGDDNDPVSRLSLKRPQAPNLCHLSLARFGVPWESDLLSGLESLIILRLTPGHSPTLEAFGAVLDRCPSLKVLRIGSTGKSGYGTGSLDRPKIQLPLLEELSVKRIPSLAALPAVVEVPRLLELDTTSHINPRKPMTSMKTIEDVLFPSNEVPVVMTALHTSGTKQVSLWWETDNVDDRLVVWVGNYCRRNDLPSRRPPHPVTFGLAIHPSLLEETLSLILQNLVMHMFSVAVHVIREDNFTTGMLTAMDHPAVDALFFYNDDGLITALPYLTLLEAENRPVPFPNLTLLVANYHLETIRESRRPAHLARLVDLYWGRRRITPWSHPFRMKLSGFLFNPNSGRFEEEGGSTFIDARDLLQVSRNDTRPRKRARVGPSSSPSPPPSFSRFGLWNELLQRSSQ